MRDSIPETFYFHITLRFREIILLSILLCNLQKRSLHLRLNFCSGENSPVDKNGPTREQSPEDETGKWKLQKVVSGQFAPDNLPAIFKQLAPSSFIHSRAKRAVKYMNPRLNVIQIILRSFIHYRVGRSGAS